MSRFVVSVAVEADGSGFKVLDGGARQAAGGIGVLNREIGFYGESVKKALAGQKLGEAEKLVAATSHLTANLQGFQANNAKLAQALAGGAPAIDKLRSSTAELAAAQKLAAQAAAAGYDPESQLGKAYIQEVVSQQRLLGSMAQLTHARDQAIRLAHEEAIAENALRDNVAKTTAGLAAENAGYERLIAAVRKGPEAFARQRHEEEVLNLVSKEGLKIGSQQAADLEREIRKRQELAGVLKREEAALEANNRASSLGSRIRSVGGQVAGALGLAGGVFAVQSVLRQMVGSISESQAAMAQLEAGVRSTGGAAGYTAQQFATYAGELQKLTGIDDEAIQGVQSVLLTFTKIGHDVFPAATQAALDLSTKLGTDLNAAALQIGKALNDPVKGVTALSKAGVQFDEVQKKTIKTLVETGQLYKAQTIILKELETQVGGSAAAFRHTLPGALAAVKNAWSDLLESLGAGLAPTLAGIAESLALSLGSGDLAAKATELGTAIGTGLRLAADAAVLLVSHLDEVKALLAAMAVLKTASILFSMVEAIKALAAAADLAKLQILGLNAAFLLSPLGLIVLGLAAVSAGLVYFTSTTRAAYEAELAQVSLHQQTAATVDLLTTATQRLTEAQRQQVFQQLATLNTQRDQAANTLAKLEEQQRFTQSHPLRALVVAGFVDPQKIDDARGRLRELKGDIDAVLKGINVYAGRTGDASKATKSLTGDVLHLSESHKKALASIENTIEGLEREAALAARRHAAAIKGSSAYQRELDLQQVEAAQLGIIEKLKEAGLAIDSKILLRVEAAVRARLEEERATQLVLKALAKIGDLELRPTKVDELFGRETEERLERLRASLLGVGRAFDFTVPIAQISRAAELVEQTATEEERRVAALAEISILLKDHLISEEAAAILRRQHGTPLIIDDRLERMIEHLKELGAPLLEAFANIGHQIGQAIGDGIATGKLKVKELGRALLDSMADAVGQMIGDFLTRWFKAMADWLVRWIATQRAAQAASAQTAVVGGVSSSGGAPAVGTAVSGATTASTTGASASAIGTVAAYAFFAVLAYKIFKGFTAKRLQYGEATVGTQVTGGNSSKAVHEAEQAIAALVKGVNQLAKDWELGLTKIAAGSVTIGKTKGGYYVRSATESINQFFASAEEAMDYAQVQALKFAEYSDKASALVVAVIRNTRARTTAQLNEDIGVARTIEGFNPSAAQKDIQSFTGELDHLRTRILELVKPSQELTNALGNIAQEEIRRWHSLRDQITGRQKTPQEDLAERQQQATMFNAEKALREAELKLKAVELTAQIAYLRARGEVVGAHGRLDGAEIGSEREYMNAKGLLLKAEVSLWQQHLDALEANMAAINLIIEGLSAIPNIELPEIHLPRSGRGGAAGSGTDLGQMIRDSQATLAQRGMSDFQIQLAAIRDKWKEATEAASGHGNALRNATRRHEEAIAAAKGNAAAIAKANQAYEHEKHRIDATAASIAAANKQRDLEIAALKEDAQARHDADLKPYLEDWGKSDWNKRFDDLQAFFAEKRKEARGIGRPVWKVDEANRRANAQLAEEAIGSLGLPMESTREQVKALGDTLGFLRDRVADGTLSAERFADVMGQLQKKSEAELYGLASGLLEATGNTAEAAKFKAYLEEANFELQVANLQFLFAQYKLLGLLGPEAIKALEAALGWITDPKNRPNFHANDNKDNAKRRLAGGSLLKDQDQADHSLKTLADAARDAAASFLDAARTIANSNRDLLTNKSLSALSPQAQRAAALSAYEDTLAKAKGGDIQALKDYVGVRDTLLGVERSFSKSGPAFAELFERVLREGSGLVLSADVEKNTVANLIAAQTATAEQSAAQIHADLLGVRSSVMDGLASLAAALGQPALLNGIPRFAKGGIATRPSLAGEAGVPEAVVPLPSGLAIPVRFQNGGGGDSSFTEQIRKSGEATVESVDRVTRSVDGVVHEVTALRIEQAELNQRLVAMENAASRSASFRESRQKKAS
jgi:hypothetical protein